MGEKLCACCLRKAPLDESEYVNPQYKYGPGLCETCRTFSFTLRQAMHMIKTNITPYWLNQHREDICKTLFAEVGEPA